MCFHQKLCGLILLALLTSCNKSGPQTTGPSPKEPSQQENDRVTIKHISIDQSGILILNGRNLNNLISIKIKDSLNNETQFNKIESTTDIEVKASPTTNLAFVLNQAYSLIISEAMGSTAFPITFSITDNSITTSSLQDGSITINKIFSSGTKNSTTFLRGDGIWASPAIASSGRTSCSSGYTLIGTPGDQSAFCFSTSRESDYGGSTLGSYYTAIVSCHAKSPKAHLCSAQEWTSACLSYSSLPSGLSNFTSSWVSGPINGSNTNYMGPGTTGTNTTACIVGGQTSNSTNLFWRCCL